MNTLKKIAMMAFVAASLMLAGCSEEAKQELEQAIEAAIPDSLEGTTWVFSGTETYDGVSADIYSTIQFTTQREGVLFLSSIFNGDTVAGGNRITYTYNKPNGVLTLYIDGESSFNMDFSVGVGLLNLKIRNGEATRTYKLVTNTPDTPDTPDNELICSEWEFVEDDGESIETRVYCFLNESELCMVHTDISRYEPQENEYEYYTTTYTIQDNSGTFYEDGYAYHFTIEGNTMSVTDDYGNAFTLTRRNASAPQSLANTTWTSTLYDYYEYNDDYYDARINLTVQFNSENAGFVHSEYTVPDLPETGSSITKDITYNYNRPKGTVTDVENNERIDFIALSDMLLIDNIVLFR